jgi:hypothetical protein
VAVCSFEKGVEKDEDDDEEDELLFTEISGKEGIALEEGMSSEIGSSGSMEEIPMSPIGSMDEISWNTGREDEDEEEDEEDRLLDSRPMPRSSPRSSPPNSTMFPMVELICKSEPSMFSTKLCMSDMDTPLICLSTSVVF